MVVHPRGAAHLIDPAKLIAASKLVYGEERYRELYGDLIPIDASRLITVEDNQRLDLAGRPFHVLHTPGHALHHFCLVDLEHRNIFTGDTFGLSYRELDSAQGAFGVPTTTPTQFDPDQLVASIDRLMATGPDGRLSDALQSHHRPAGCRRIAEGHRFHSLPRWQCVMAPASIRMPPFTPTCARCGIDLARRHGLADPQAHVDEYLSKDLDLNTQGLIAWVKRQRR